jgi:iron complex transport system substrate-binding protein
MLSSTARRLVAALVLVLVLGAAGCGSADDESPAAAAKAETGVFPVTVTHRFGTTTVPAKPKRIAVVGLNEQDILLALGEKPVATTEWYGDQPYAVWPWARPALGDAKPAVLENTDGFQFERIAALRPDLIVGTNSGMKRADYRKLSAIAPTIASVRGGTDYFSRWDEQTVTVAKAIGKEAAGRSLVKRIKEAYAKAAAEHPEFRGKTATFSQNGFYSGQLYLYPEGLNTEFLTYLGFEINPKVTALAKQPGVQVPISAEQLPILDSDVIVFATEKPSDIPALMKVKLFPRIPAIADKRAVFTDATLSGAMYFISPLSLPYVLERLVPQLEAAIAGKAPRRLVAG